MTYVKKFKNLLAIFMLYAMKILRPDDVITDHSRLLPAKEYKLLK